MRPLLLPLLLVMLPGPPAHGCAERSLSPAKTERIALPRELAFPNGIAAAPDGTLYVGGVTDGTIYRRNMAGEWSVLRSGSPEIGSVASLRLDPRTGLLWGTAPDVVSVFAGRPARAHRVFAIDAQNGSLRLALDTPEGGFANDVALGPDGMAYVSDSLLGRIWRIDPVTRRFVIYAEHPDWRAEAGARSLGPSGLALLPGGDLIVGLFSQGRLVRIALTADGMAIGSVPLAQPLLRPDGLLALDDRWVLLVEGGTGKLRCLDLATGALTTLAEGLAGPVNLTRSGSDVLVTESGIADPATFDPSRPPTSSFAIRRISRPAME